MKHIMDPERDVQYPPPPTPQLIYSGQRGLGWRVSRLDSEEADGISSYNMKYNVISVYHSVTFVTFLQVVFVACVD